MIRRVALVLLGLALLVLLVREGLLRRPERLFVTTSGQVEMCLACHTKEKPDPAHAPEIMGCSVCHLGDALATEKAAAHKGVVVNPGDLRVVEKTCGIEGCHPQDVKKVKNSLMATNRGILATLRFYWGEAADQNGDFSVREIQVSGENSLALDYYRKLCATCHLWKPRGDLPGVFGDKGGGCTACHRIQPARAPGTKDNPKPHPLITRKVPTENCLRCHNRSARIGISYTGVYESEQYGTPYEDGDLSSQRLADGRFYLELADDIHHRRGMACIDCHTRDEIMGDGNRYAHYEEALEISCTSCHAESPGLTRKRNQLNNLSRPGADFILTGKLDQKPHPLRPPKPGTCDYPAHRRLSCESCHSPWVPQCYGCHVKQDRRETHLDKLTMKETKGQWQEGRSYMRYERPMLGIWKDRVVIVTPGCQDIVTVVDENGTTEKSFNSLTMAALNPHTTQAKGLECVDCHASPKTVGLGEGTLWQENGRWRFSPIHQGEQTAVGVTPPLDGFVDLEGNSLQRGARAELRPFDKEELQRILRVGLCVRCHKTYDDPVFKDYDRSRSCPVFDEQAGLPLIDKSTEKR